MILFHTNRIQNRKGSTAVLFLFFVPILATLAFSFGFVSYFILHKTKLRSTCITESLAIQKSLVNHQERLFKLNPIARLLRMRLNVAYIQLAAATATLNFPAAAQAALQINQTKKAQQTLDRVQRLIIRIAKAEIRGRSLLLQLRLTQMSFSTNSTWSDLLNAFTVVRIKKSADLAVVPDIPEIAPVYELATNHKTKQSLAYVWHHVFSSKDDTQTILQIASFAEMNCGSSAQKEEGGQWKFQITADKY